MWVGLGSKVSLTFGGGAKGAQEPRCGAIVGRELAHNVGKAELDGVCILQGGELDDAALAEIHVDFGAHEATLIVKETMALVALGGRSALDAVDFDVLAAADGYAISRHSALLWSGVRSQV